MDRVDEFLSPDFHHMSTMGFEFLLLLTIVTFVVSRDRISLIEVVLTLILAHMALYSKRYIPLFCLVIAPILSKHAESILNKSEGSLANFIKKRANNIARVDASMKGFVWMLLAVVAVWVGVEKGIFEYKFDEKKKPVAAVEFFKKEGFKGNMFNNDEFGDYIIYSAYPQYKVFIDDRIDTYGVERLKEYLKLIYMEPGWNGVIEKYNITWIIFDADSILSRFLLEKPGWHLVYADKVANIFVRNIPENEYLIRKFPTVQPIIFGKNK